MKSITQNNQNDNRISASILNFFKKYKLYSCLKAANAYKKKGISIMEVFGFRLLTLGWGIIPISA